MSCQHSAIDPRRWAFPEVWGGIYPCPRAPPRVLQSPHPPGSAHSDKSSFPWASRERIAFYDLARIALDLL